MRILKYGGQLFPGDFIAVSEGNHISLGWYFGDGVGGTLQYYHTGAPGNCYESYKEWEKITDAEVKKRHWATKKYSGGFTLKCLYKCYINTVHSTRVIKINNPEEIFTTSEDLEEYKTSKEILIKLNFVKP